MMSEQLKKYYVDENDAGQRLDTFLCSICPDLSRSFIQKQIKSSLVKVNEKEVKASYAVKEDDLIELDFSFENEFKITPENTSLEIKYEDSEMLVVNKPSNMLTHPTSTEKSGTLVNALLFHYPNSLAMCNGINRPGIVHRLDRNTSGLLMIAKTDEAYEFLKTEMQKHNVEKKYYAIVCGNIEKDEETIKTDIGRHPTKPQKMAVVQKGKPSVTHYKVLERFGTHTFLEINLETGRTHQIRVHMSHIGHPIVNDTLYGGGKLSVKTQEQVLQAFSLKFTSPFDKKERTISIDYDNDIIKVLNYLRSKK